MKFILIGGGQVNSVEGKIHLVKANKYIQKSGSNILFISAASDDAQGYINTVKNEFSSLNFKVLKSTEISSAKLFFDWADIIYLGGGSTEKLMHFLKKINFISLLNEKHFIVGFSAGAIAVCKQGYSLDKNKLFEGFGLLPFSVTPHFIEGSSVPKLDSPLNLHNGNSLVVDKTGNILEKIIDK